MSAVVALLAACGGNGPGGQTYTIGGAVIGLVASNQFGPLVLQNNGGNSLTISSSGAFSFTSKVGKGNSYAVTVLDQPSVQNCTVANGTGTANADVANVTVTCETNAAFSLGGTVSGLRGTLVLHSGVIAQDVTVDTNGAFAFLTTIPMGAPYAVTVATQPSGQTCTVQNGTGTMGSANVANVAVVCADDPVGSRFSIGGTVIGLTSGQLLLGLQDSVSMGVTISVSSNGSFDFAPYEVFSGDQYFVTIEGQPAGQTCSITNGTGTANGNVTNIEVLCVASSARFSVGGTITGLAGAGLRIENDPTNRTQPAPGAATFALPTQLVNGAVYDVGISAQPTGQTCLITRAHGVVAAADVSNVSVTCIDNVTAPLVGTYTAPALAPGSYAYLTLFADGTYLYAGLENDPGCGGPQNGNGVEYGVYDYDATADTLTIKNAVVDTNGNCGVWAGSAYASALTITGSGSNKTLTLDAGGGSVDFVPVASQSGQLYGSFADRYQKRVWLFRAASGPNNVEFLLAETQQDAAPNSQGYEAGVESACGAINGTPAQGTLNRDYTPFCQAPAPITNGPIDTNGNAGLSGFFGSWMFSANGNALTTSSFAGTRMVPN